MAGLIACILVGVAAQVRAADAEPDAEAYATAWAQNEAAIQGAEASLADIRARRKNAGPGLDEILAYREARTWGALYGMYVGLAESVATALEEGVDPGPYFELAASGLERAPAEFRTQSRAWLDAFSAERKVPETAPDLAARLVALERTWGAVQELFQAGERHVRVAERLELAPAVTRDTFVHNVGELAETMSVALQLATRLESEDRARLSAKPDDADLHAMQRASHRRVEFQAHVLNGVIGLMAPLELPVDAYQAQMIAATGQITTDIFNLDVLLGLAEVFGRRAWAQFTEQAPALLFNLLLFAVVLFVAVIAARLIGRLAGRALEASHLNLSELMRRTVITTVRNVVILIGVLMGLAQFGISLGPLLAGLGIAGFVIGFALQDSLSNFASGMLMLIYRPFDVGDIIESAGVTGKVSHMTLVNTTIITADNQSLIIPNNTVWRGVITNATAQNMRRVDLTFGVAYDEDLRKVQQLLTGVMSNHPKVLPDPAPNVRVHTLGASSVDFIARPWVYTEDYWDVYWDLTRAVKERFDAEGISIPFPTRAIHVVAAEAGEKAD
jgi:small conductance mechanosensitive channel